jgi:DHA1 family bicyclomycin/chloramphenicol resistance-like MFS transporter
VRRLGLIILLGALTAFGPMSIDMYLPAFPVLTAHFHTSASAVQLTLTACLAGLALGQLVYGPMSDALGRRRPLYGGLVGYVVASGLCAVAPSVGVLVGLRFVQGFGGAAGIVIARAVVRDMYDGVAAARYFSLLMVVNGLAPMLAPLLGSEIMRYGSWTGVFAVLAGYGLILLLGMAFGLPETLPPERRRSGKLADTVRTFGRLSRDRAFVGYAVCGGLVFAAMFAYISGTPFILQEIYHISPRAFAIAFGTNALGIVLVGQLNALLLRRFPPRTLLTGSVSVHLLGALGVVAAVGTHRLALLLPPLFLVVSSVGAVLPNTTALALSGHPDAAGSASAVLGVGQFFLGALAAPVVGLGGTGTALPMAVLILALSVAANAALWTLGYPAWRSSTRVRTTLESPGSRATAHD